jgi:hypothetical protein
MPARDREPARPETYLQATVGCQRHFSLVKVLATAAVSAAIRLSCGECRLRELAQPLPLRPSGEGAMRGRQTVRCFASIGIVAGIVALAGGGRAQPAEAQAPVTRVHGIATGLAACWRPPHADDQVTVRISFTREGAVIGEPRIVFVRSSGGRADDTVLADSMMSAIRDCTPLPFSTRLGAAIAGQLLAIRFIGRSRATIVAPP